MIILGALFRRAICLVDFCLITGLITLAAIVPGSAGRRAAGALFQPWCRAFVRALDVDLRLHQHYRGSLPTRYILVANHPSCFEDIGIPALFRVRSLAKAEVADWWIVGRIARATGTLFVKRESSESRRAMSSALTTAARAGDCLALYPEGGCKGRRLGGRFFNGAFRASIDSGTPILPVFLHYHAQETFEWADQHLLYKLWQIAIASNRQADYHVFEPVDPAHFSSPEAMKDHLHRLYLAWQHRFLD